MNTTSNYHRIAYLGRGSALRASGARRSAMLDFSRLQQVWTWLEQRAAHHGWDIFLAWEKATDVATLCREMRDQLLWLTMWHRGPNGYHPEFDPNKALEQIAVADAQMLHRKGSTYGDSWKKRGGVGAFMMLARKWDRIGNIMGTACGHTMEGILSRNPGDIMDDVDDLRCYLLLVEDEMLGRATCQHHYVTNAMQDYVCEKCGESQPEADPGAGYVNQD